MFKLPQEGALQSRLLGRGRRKGGRGAKDEGKEAAAVVVAAKEKAEEKVEAWMVLLAVVEELEESFDDADLSCEFNSSDNWFDDVDSLPDLQPISNDSKIDEMDLLDYQYDLNKNCGNAYTIPDTYPFLPSDPDTCSKAFDGLDSLSEEIEYAPMKEEAYMMVYKASVLQGTPGVLSTDIDLYDLGASHHMSGFCHRYMKFVKLTLKPITAADRKSFSAVEKGDIWVYLPNEKEKASRVLLKDVLYVPAMGVTLVSISCIAAARSTVVFTGSTCLIFNNEKKVIGTIQVRSGLYQVFSTCPLEGKYAGEVRVELSIDELHHRLGHVLHERARMLVSKNLWSWTWQANQAFVSLASGKRGEEGYNVGSQRAAHHRSRW